MSRIERRTAPSEATGVERSVEVRVGSLGGFELRPTRLFVWSGQERQEKERIVSLGSEPRSLDMARRERELRAGSVSMRTFGNPLMTAALASVHAARKLADEFNRDIDIDEPEKPKKRRQPKQ